MLTDRMRVELALLPRMMHSVVTSGMEDPNHAEGKAIIALLDAACMEPINDLKLKAQAKLVRRIERVHKETLRPYADGGSKSQGVVTAGKMGLIIFYLIQDLIHAGILELYEGSTMVQAIERFMPFLQDLWEIKAVDDSAQKQARRVLEDLRRQGYYQVPN